MGRWGCAGSDGPEELQGRLKARLADIKEYGGMNTPQKPGKRIVSKGTFASNIGNIVAWSSASFAAFSIAMLYAAGALWVVLRYGIEWRDAKFIVPMVVFVVLVVFSLCSLYIGIQAGRQARKVKVGVPLTRANTADLPAPDSLVRASAEPVQEQRAVLLRAATQGIETHEEQLVRASEGAQDSHK
jgi:hypothetical protein